MTSTTTSPPKRSLHIDLETFSDEPLPKCGVYRYAGSPAFEILLTSYAFDNEPVITIDNAYGEQMPQELLDALEDPNVVKIAQNAVFERVCLSRVLGHWLDPSQWRCSMVMASYLTLPLSLANVAVALNVTEQKMEEGKDLIRYFSVPCKPTKANGGRTRNYPTDAPDKWAVYKQYNAQDVETERAVVHELMKHPLPEHEWELYALDQRINDRGVRIDRQLVKQAIEVDKVFTEQAFQRAQELTGLENPGSVSQLKAWLADQDMPMESMAKKLVQEKAKEADGIVGELLNLRLELSNTSSTAYSVGMMGATGAAGAAGSAGKGVKSTAVTYQVGSSGTTAPTSTWGTTIPTVGAGKYLWTRTIITYTDSTTSTSYSVGMMGATGQTGAQGATGPAGADAITMAVTSSNGTIFKNSSIETVLTAHVYKAGVEVTNTTELAALGTIKWYKDGSTTAAATGKTLTVSAGNVTNKATYIAQLE